MTMSVRSTLHLNLSRNPARNRLFFRLSLFVLGSVFIVSSVSAGFLIQRIWSERQRLQTSLEQAERKTVSLIREERRNEAAVREAEQELGKTVVFINDAVFRKAYRLTGILSSWETALPDESYVSAFSPVFSGSAALTIRARVVSRNLEDLHVLIENLRNRDFRDIRVENETRDDRGRLIADLTMSHERLF